MSDGATWEVEVRVNGETHLTIGHNHLAGDPEINEDIVENCAQHLLAFIGRATPPAAPAGGESKEARSARRRGHTCSSQYVMRELPDPDCAACNATPAQSIGDEGEREAAIERIISIRNGMTPDMEARAIVRRELAALGAAPSNGDEGQSQWEPVKKLMAANEQLQERLAKARAALEEARQSLALADKMISEHIEEYHDFDYEPHQVPPELASLRAIEHHLMGSLILDEDIAALKDAQS